MDDPTSTPYSASWSMEGTGRAFAGIGEPEGGVLLALHRPRQPLFRRSSPARGMSKAAPVQFGAAMKQLDIRHLGAYSLEARGRSERSRTA